MEQFFTMIHGELFLRLALAVVLGGIIGIERGNRNHDAGLKTHILVCLGSASVMALSGLIYHDTGSGDITRMSAQVISGIGFLGAGSIIIGGNKIRGLTTAATLWTTACLGLVIGAGYYILSLYSAFFISFTMYCLRPLSKKIQEHKQNIDILVNVANKKGLLELVNYLNEQKITVKGIKMGEHGDDETDINVTVSVKADREKLTNIILISICSVEGVNDASIID